MTRTPSSIASSSDFEPAQVSADRAETLASRAKLARNRNLLTWYEALYRTHFGENADWEEIRVLEIGSGSSPLSRFHPQVKTSDVLALDYLDYCFDCHDIDSVTEIPDRSLDIITLTNVLHHLRDPLRFLTRAARKLRPGGRVVATEPYFSSISSAIYRYLHHEPVDFEITEPRLADVTGPLASANIALPYLIFFRNPEWAAVLDGSYEMSSASIEHFSSISYMATGGISRRIPMPRTVYRALFRIDLALSRRFPLLLSSFFTVKLTVGPESNMGAS